MADSASCTYWVARQVQGHTADEHAGAEGNHADAGEKAGAAHRLGEGLEAIGANALGGRIEPKQTKLGPVRRKLITPARLARFAGMAAKA